MWGRLPKAIVVAGMACAAWITLAAQTAAPSLESQLETIYKLTRVESSNQTVSDPGALLKLTRPNLLYATPMGNLFRCDATVSGDKVKAPGGLCVSSTKTSGSFLPSGQLLYITKIKVNLDKDIVTLEMVEAAAGENGNAAWPRFKTGVNFTFDHGYLSKADAGQVAEQINTVLPLDTGQEEQAAAPAAGRQTANRAQPAQAQAQAAPSQIQIGMTEDQVQRILGQPTSTTNTRGITVFVYQKVITFQNGKVSAIQ